MEDIIFIIYIYYMSTITTKTFAVSKNCLKMGFLEMWKTEHYVHIYNFASIFINCLCLSLFYINIFYKKKYFVTLFRDCKYFLLYKSLFQKAYDWVLVSRVLSDLQFQYNYFTSLFLNVEKYFEF